MVKKAVILSGGLGTRLRPFTEIIPKPLLPIGEKAVLEIQIEQLCKYGFDEVILATNYRSEYIESFFGNGSSYGVNLRISKEEEPLGTVGPVKLIEKDLNENPFIVMNGDVLSLADLDKLYTFACHNDSPLTVSIRKIIMPYAFGNIFFDGDIVTNIEEKADIITHALAGIYVMKPDIFKYIPPNTYFGMDMLIKILLEKNVPIYKYEIKEYWLDIGRAEDYEKAQSMFDTLCNDE